MTNWGPASAFLLMGGHDISSETFELTETVEELMEQTNGLGTSWEEHKGVGVARVELEASGGLYDDGTAKIVEALQEMGSTQQVVTLGLEGSAIGDPVAMIAGAFAAKWKRLAARDGLTKAHAEYMCVGPRHEGNIVHGRTSETTATGDTEATSVDGAAQTTTGAVCVLHLLALVLGGYTNLTVRVLDSPDDAVFGLLQAFDNMTDIGDNRKVVSGTIERYLAMDWTFNGAGSGQSATPFVAVART